MHKSFLKVWSRSFFKHAVNYFRSELDDDDLQQSAIVFAPHPDDETLGCGGTIIKKKRAGADIGLVFMTDGTRSHSHFIAKDKLKSIRFNEALAASRVFELEENKVFFLEFKDGELSHHQESAIHKVSEILDRLSPDQVFVPYAKETVPDHSATNRIVVSALRLRGRKTVVYEYPVWFWRHWPWTDVPMRRRREILDIVRNSIESSLTLLKDFRFSVHTGDVLELKRTALNQHQSQITRLIPDPNWPTLSDVSHEEFLDCFFQDYEIFRRYCMLG